MTERRLIQVVLIVLAAVAFAVGVLLAFGIIDKHSAAAVKDAVGWLGVGSILFVLAHL